MNFAKVHFNKNGSKGPAGGQLMKHKTAKVDCGGYGVKY